MIIGLASKSFVNKRVDLNLKTILLTMREASLYGADAILFGEAFLQGFDALSWDFEIDKQMALRQDDEVLKMIRLKSKELRIAIGFGYLELDDDVIYSSYQFIDKTGEILNNYRRVTPGWKEPVASPRHYQEGDIFQTFQFMNKSFVVGLCGDFWFEENIKRIKQIYHDVVIWPVYLNYAIDTWNKGEKYEYAKQAKLIGRRVLFINSLSINPLAHGGCYDYQNGEIIHELPMTRDDIIYIEI